MERDSQKGIVIGRGGRMLKRIGQAARREIEGLLDHQVYLDLWVKTRYKWQRNKRELRRLGTHCPGVSEGCSKSDNGRNRMPSFPGSAGRG